MQKSPMSRRTFLGTGAVSVASVAATTVSTSASTEGSAESASYEFEFEIQRTDEEWQAMLTNDQYGIMRLGKTERKFTSPYTEETADGTYWCQGCELPLYDSRWKVQLNIGWVFFRHSRDYAVLTKIDESAETMNGMAFPASVPMNAACRRCGSHLGHIVYAQKNLVHCINGTALDFRPAQA